MKYPVNKSVFVIGPRGFPNVQGGIERFSENIYPLLVKEGFDVTSFAIKKYGGHKEWEGVKFVYLPAPGSKSLERLSYNFFATLYCIKKRPSIIHIHSIASGFFIFLLKCFQLKVIARYNSRDYLHGKWGRIGKWVLLFSEKQFLLADYIVVNNKSYLEHFKSLGRTHNIAFLPNGVDLNPALQTDKSVLNAHGLEDQKFILTIGRLTEEKNFETIIEAFLKLNNPLLKLVIVGEMAHNDGYGITLRNKYKHISSVIFTGKLDRPALNALYKACNIYIQASFYEGMPNTVLEAMSFNCKMLLSNIAAHQQFELPNNIYFESTNINLLSAMIKAQLSSAIPINYANYIKNYSWPNILEVLMTIQQKVIA